GRTRSPARCGAPCWPRTRSGATSAVPEGVAREERRSPRCGSSGVRRSDVSSVDRARAGTRHLVLVGGGHAHVSVLRSFAMQPVEGAHVTVVSAASQSAYSGMVPGVL